MRKVAIIMLLVLAAACKAKQSDSSVQKIKAGSKEVAQGVKEEAQKLAKKAEAAGKKVKQDVKSETHH